MGELLNSGVVNFSPLVTNEAPPSSRDDCSPEGGKEPPCSSSGSLERPGEILESIRSARMARAFMKGSQCGGNNSCWPGTKKWCV